MPQQRGIVQSSQKIEAYEHVPRSYPFVKWAGGKSQIMSELDSLIPSEFDRYFEPFLGGGAMFFHISSKNIQFASHLSDINEDLINAYRVVKDDVEVLIRLLKHHEKEYKNSRHKYYYQLRAKIDSLTDVERAARFITLNKTCYNGLYRVNSKGLFNVPIGRYKNPVIVYALNNKNKRTQPYDSIVCVFILIFPVASTSISPKLFLIHLNHKIIVWAHLLTW